MDGVNLKEFAKEKKLELEFDPLSEIDQVRAEDIMPATPSFDRQDPQKALVCPQDQCHWKPCTDCSPKRKNCDFAERNPMHLGKRTGFILKNKREMDEHGVTTIKTVAEPCVCHPGFASLNDSLINNEVYSVVN